MNESDVQFAKAKLENDDGGVEYEIEFYSGRTEYDYTIDAVSGNIIEYDVDYDWTGRIYRRLKSKRLLSLSFISCINVSAH